MDAEASAGASPVDSTEFLAAYRETIAGQLATWPQSWLQTYEFDSCLKSSQDKEVFLARDRRDTSWVILRVTMADSAESADAEWAILRQLDHPGIPKAVAATVENGRSYLAREYFPGTPLDQVLARGPLSTQRTEEAARELCGILGYLHRQDPPVVHRDLKPANIICKLDGSLGLTDFGIARTLKPGDAPDTSYAGTLPYAPPEQYGYAQSTPQTDIYALGIVLICLLTGSTERVDLARRIPDSGLRAIVEKCIAFDPKNRFGSTDQIIRRLDGLRRRKRRPLIWVGAGGVALGIVIAGGVIAPLVSPEPPPITASLSPTSWPPIPAPPAGPYRGGGNYPGNLSNGGFAVAGDGELYVATGTGILAMSPDGAVLRKVSDEASAASLNFYDGALYYQQGSSVRRMNPATGETNDLMKVRTERLYIDSGKLYYPDATDHLTLYSASIDGGEREKIDDAATAYYRQLSAGWQFYAQGDEAELTLTNLTTGELFRPGENGALWLSVWDGHLYFGSRSKSALQRVDLKTGNRETLVSQHYDFTVATEKGVFGMSTSVEELARISAEGKVTTVVPRRTGFFCVAGDWVFYQQDKIDGKLRMVRADGTGDHAVPTT